MTKLILITAIAAAGAVLAPRPAAAQSCTDGYVTCLNDSYDLTGALQTMADVECFAAYTSCVGSKIKFW